MTGLAYWEAHGLLGGITISQALEGPRSSGGAMNILLIGLDSRKIRTATNYRPRCSINYTPATRRRAATTPTP